MGFIRQPEVKWYMNCMEASIELLPEMRGHFTMHEIYLESTGIPRCEKCGGLIKPDVVLYEEGLDQATINGAVHAISQADVLIIGGTSLTVYPAAGLIDYYNGNKLVLINKSVTPMDSRADLLVQGPIGESFQSVIGGMYGLSGR